MGYGKVSVEKKVEHAHRVAWRLTNGNIPDGKIVLHGCDTERCINPDHLYLGTHADNSADMVNRGSVHRGIGVRKLSNEDVFDIKKRIAVGESAKSIAEDYPVHVATIHNIRRGRTWQQKGERGYLTKPDVVEIKRMLAQNIKQQDIADSFGVSLPTISSINTGRIWRHVN